MNKNISLLQGTNWHWRQGVRQGPMHSHNDESIYPTRELYLSVKDEKNADEILLELQSHNISAKKKKTHSSCDAIPAGTLIVYADQSEEFPDPKEVENMNNLKAYILANEGKIGEVSQRKPSNNSFVQRLFNYFKPRGK